MAKVKRTVSTGDHSIEHPAVSVQKAMAAMNFESSSRPAGVRTIYEFTDYRSYAAEGVLSRAWLPI